MMRRLLALLILLAAPAWAATYYVKNGGSDAATGLSDALAWESIAKVNGSSFNAGDSILFKRGSTWREQLTVPSSGSAGNVITFGAYSSGADPIISGSDLKNTVGSWTNEASDTEVTPRLAAATDDGNWNVNGLWNSGGEVPFGNDGAAENCFFRIGGVAIPQGATIVSAKLTFRCTASTNGTTINLNVMAEDADNPNPPTTKTDGNGRAVTGTTAWNDVAMTAGSNYDTPDITTAVQNVVNRGGWASGQAMQFFVKDNGSTANKFGKVGQYENSAAQAALLTVTYSSTTSLWYLSSVSTDPGILAHDEILGARKLLKGNLASQWNYWWDDPNDRLYVYSTANPTTLATNIEVGARDNCIVPNATHDITLSGLDLRHSRANAISVFWGGVNWTVDACDFTQVSKYGMQFNNGGAGSVTNSTFTDWGVIDGQQYAIQVIGNGATESGPVDVIGCTFELTQGANVTECMPVMSDDGGWVRTFSNNSVVGGTYLKGSGVTIWKPASIATSITVEKNTISGTSSAGIMFDAIETNGCTPAIVCRYNKIANACLGDVLDTEAIRIRGVTTSSPTLIAYNIVNGTYDGANAHHGIFVKGADGVKLYGNVIYGCDDGIRVGAEGADTSIGTDVRNNICSINRGYGLTLEATNTITGWGYNCWYGNVSGALSGKAAGSGDVTADPLLTNPAGGDFTLQAGSPCIDAGTDLTSTYQMALMPGSTWVTSILTGNQYNAGQKWECGAYLYSNKRQSLIIVSK